jgi:adenylate cyclase
MGGAERAPSTRVEAATTRRTTVLYARVDAKERPRGPALRRRVRCVAALSQAAELSGGRVLQKRADAVVALFATPDVATAAAARMQACAEAGGHKSADMQVRIGYQTGAVAQQGEHVGGQTVELALEFSRRARDGQIVTSAETASTLSPGVRTAVRPLAAWRDLREVAWRDAANQILAARKSASAAQAGALRLSYRDKVLLRRRDRDFVTLGRDPGMDIVISEPTASRHHCDIVRRDGEFLLRDHSTNGTYVAIDGEGEVHLHVATLILRKAGWIALGLSADLADEAVRYACE